jgi:hypothetical protein
MDLDEFRTKLWEQSRSEFRRRCVERELREMTDDQETNWHNELHEEEGWFEQEEVSTGAETSYSWRNPNLTSEEKAEIEAFISGLLVRSETASKNSSNQSGGSIDSGCGRTDRPCCGGGCSR